MLGFSACADGCDVEFFVGRDFTWDDFCCVNADWVGNGCGGGGCGEERASGDFVIFHGGLLCRCVEIFWIYDTGVSTGVQGLYFWNKEILLCLLGNFMSLVI